MRSYATRDTECTFLRSDRLMVASKQLGNVLLLDRRHCPEASLSRHHYIVPGRKTPFMGIIRLLWWTTKFSVKHIVIPIATTALIAAVLDRVADRVSGQHQVAPNGMYQQPLPA